QNPAGALGQRPHPGQHQDAPRDLQGEGPTAHQDRGCLPLDGQPQLPADGHHDGVPDARHDRALLPGLVSDAADRCSAVHRVHLFHRCLLPYGGARTLPQNLDENLSLSARPDGPGYRTHGHQYEGGDGSSVWYPEPLVRTPKYRVAKKGEKSQASKYRKRLKLAPWIEIFIGCYFFAAILYTFTNHNYFTAPFLILFVIGYWYTGLMSLLQGRFE